MKLKLLLIALLVATTTLLSGCSFNSAVDTVDITDRTITALETTDTLLSKYGKYSTSTEALIALDELRFDLKDKIENGFTFVSLESHYYKALAIYNTLFAEVVDRKGELTIMQLAELEALNRQLIDLNDIILEFNETSDGADIIEVADYILRLLAATSTVFKYYAILAV